MEVSDEKIYYVERIDNRIDGKFRIQIRSKGNYTPDDIDIRTYMTSTGKIHEPVTIAYRNQDENIKLNKRA